MDVVLLTSRHEGLPNVLLEAQSLGVPVVAPDVGGTGETIANGVTGWAVRHAEPLTHATYQLARGRELDVLTGAEAKAIYPALREDLARIAAGWYCAELIDRFTVEHMPAAPLFDLLETALRHLDAGFAAPLVCRWFDLHILDRSGFRPELAQCVSCQSALEERENAWNAASGGALCDSCARRTASGLSLSVRALKSLRSRLTR